MNTVLLVACICAIAIAMPIAAQAALDVRPKQVASVGNDGGMKIADKVRLGKSGGWKKKLQDLKNKAEAEKKKREEEKKKADSSTK